MPLFFIISGYVYNHDKWKNLGIKQLAIHRAKDYILPYFVFGFINLGLNMFIEARHLAGTELLKSTLRHMFWLFYSFGSAEKMPNCSALWFLPCLFLCSIYIFLLLNINNPIVRYFICLCGLGINALLAHFNIPQLPWHIDTAFIGSIFILIGYELKKHNMLSINMPNLKTIICLIIIGCISTYTNIEINFNSNIYGNIIFTFISSILLSYSCLWSCVKLKDVPALSYFGRGTIIVMSFSYFF